MFRAFVLSIVLTLAVAPNAALLCIASCHPQPAASSVSHYGKPSAVSSASHHGEPSATSSASHHEAPSAASSMVWDDTCPDCANAGLGAAQFLREEVRRNVSALDVVHAILVPCHQLAHSTIDARPGQEPGREGSLEARRLPTILRI